MRPEETNEKSIRMKVAILDMYKGESNQGMRNIHDLLRTYGEQNDIVVEKQLFDVRREHQLPGLEFDVYISTGGPGSPVDHEGWEKAYKKWILAVLEYNKNAVHKKYVFLICHSFQVVCYHLQLAHVCIRKSESFGIFPMHKTAGAEDSPYLNHLPEPFFAVDSRKWQVIQPNHRKLEEMGAHVMAIEKLRPHVPLERATMAIEFSPEVFGTQFHPEADPQGMIHYLTTEKKQYVIDTYGKEKYDDMMMHLNDPDKILLTRESIIPVFLDKARHALTLHSPIE
jgi:homoserine O-succinyltransferase/O-acetyltransferase